MTEKDLIGQLKELRQIKPREDWVVLTKSRILAEPEKEEGAFHVLLGWRLAFAPVISVFIIIGLFGFAQNTVPGDFLFPVKKITETAQVGLSPAAEKPKVHLELANRRLEELGKIAEANRVKSLASAIEEFRGSMAEAAKGLMEMDLHVTSSDSVLLKGIVEEAQKLEENKQRLEAVLGASVGDTEELENAITNVVKKTVDYLIADLETRTLSEEDQKLLVEAKEAFENGDYSLALEKLLLSNK